MRKVEYNHGYKHYANRKLLIVLVLLELASLMLAFT